MTDPIKQALEVALTALELAQDNLRDHGDNCFLHDEGEYNACFCGKDSLVNHLQSVVERSAAELERAHAEQAQEPTPAAVSGDGPPLLVRLNGLGVEPQARAEQAEPVLVYRGRCVIDCGDNGHHDVELLRMIPKGTKLFTHPAPVQAEPTLELSRMTAHRAAFFMERFKKEEKLLGPNEQAAVDFVLAMLNAAPQPAAPVVGLTVEQIHDISAATYCAQDRDSNSPEDNFIVLFARAAIAEFCRVNGIKPPEKGGAR